MRGVFKKGIALLITLFFLMAITISIGVGFKHVNEAKSSIRGENFLLQTSIVLDDVLTFLKDSPELEMIKKDKSGTAFDVFLSQSEFIPFELSGMKVGISIKSARSKINLNNLLDEKQKQDGQDTQKMAMFKSFLSQNNVNLSYVGMLQDSVSKHDINYNPATGILDAKPGIFRDYITSIKHLQEINEYYKNTYYENSLSKIDFTELFYFDKSDQKYCIDYFYMTAMTKSMIFNMSLEDAKNYELNFMDEQKQQEDIYGFKLCKKEDRQFINVQLEIIQGEKTANISFEYDIQQAKGYNFSYEI
jgi:hypothetical protein